MSKLKKPNQLIVDAILQADQINRHLRKCVGNGDTDAEEAMQRLTEVINGCQSLKHKCITARRSIKQWTD